MGDKVEKNGIGGTCRMYGVEERCIQSLVGKLEGKRQVGEPRFG